MDTKDPYDTTYEDAFSEATVRLAKKDELIEELMDALIDALPFVEDALKDETYKKEAVRKVLNKMKELISNFMLEQIPGDP